MKYSLQYFAKLLLLCCLALLLVACKNSSSDSSSPPHDDCDCAGNSLDSVTILEDDVTLFIDTSTFIHANVSYRDPQGELVEIPLDEIPDTYTFVSSAPDVVSIDRHGLITALSAGDADIKLTVTQGNQSVNDILKVTSQPIEVFDLVIDDPPAHLHAFETTSLTVTAQYYELNGTLSSKTFTEADPRLTWSSSDEDIISVDQSGNLMALSQGQAIITSAIDSYGTITTDLIH